MSPELLAKVQAVYDKIHTQQKEKKAAKVQAEKERKQRLYGSAGVKVYHTESGKLSAIVPVGMTSLKFNTVCNRFADKIEDFKNNSEQKTITI